MTVRAEVDQDVCNGYGNCTVTAPRVFALDRDTHLSHAGPVGDDDVEDVEDAVLDCPVQAIRLARE